MWNLLAMSNYQWMTIAIMKNNMNNNDKFVRLETLRDVDIALQDAQLAGQIIPEVVFEILKKLEDMPYQELPPEVINEMSEHGID